MTVTAPCPACEAEVDVLATIDDECRECGTERAVLYAVADGFVDRDELVEGHHGYEIPNSVWDELEERKEAMDDPAEENQYLKEVVPL